MTLRTALLASVAAVGCGGGGSPVAPPAPRTGTTIPAPATETVAPATRLPWRLRLPLRYEILRYDSLHFLNAPQNPPQVTGRRALVTVRPESGRVVVTLDSVAALSGGRLSASTVDSARGVRWELRLSGSAPSGELRRNKSSVLLGQVESVIQLLFPQLPQSGVRAGDAWSDSTSYPVRLDAFEATESASRRSVARAAPGSGGLVVEGTDILTRRGNAMQGGRAMAMQGGGRRVVEYNFSAQGWVATLRAVDSLDLRVSVPDGALAIPVRWRATIIARLRDTLPR